jgi:hypothetical protein
MQWTGRHNQNPEDIRSPVVSSRGDTSVNIHHNYTIQVRTKWAAGPFVVFMTPVFTMDVSSHRVSGEENVNNSPAFVAIPESDLRDSPFRV